MPIATLYIVQQYTIRKYVLGIPQQVEWIVAR